MCLHCDHVFAIEDCVISNPLAKIVTFEAVKKLLEKCVSENAESSNCAEICSLRMFVRGARK